MPSNQVNPIVAVAVSIHGIGSLTQPHLLFHGTAQRRAHALLSASSRWPHFKCGQCEARPTRPRPAPTSLGPASLFPKNLRGCNSRTTPSRSLYAMVWGTTDWGHRTSCHTLCLCFALSAATQRLGGIVRAWPHLARHAVREPPRSHHFFLHCPP